MQSVFFIFRWGRDRAFLCLKLPDALADQVEDLPIGGASLIFGDVVQFSVELGVNFYSQVLVLFISHQITVSRNFGRPVILHP